MATNIINYAPEASPPSPLLAAPSAIPAVSPVLPQPLVMQAPAPAPAAGGLWNGHLKPAEIQIMVIGTVVHTSNAHSQGICLRKKNRVRAIANADFSSSRLRGILWLSVLIAGLFNAFFLVLSLRLLWRR